MTTTMLDLTPREDQARTCPAGHDHPVLTTSIQCSACQSGDILAIAEEVFADLLPSGSDVNATEYRQHENLRHHATRTWRAAPW